MEMEMEKERVLLRWSSLREASPRSREISVRIFTPASPRGSSIDQSTCII